MHPVDLKWTVPVAIAALAVGVLATNLQALALVFVGILALVLLPNAAGRLALVVAGGFAVLQSESLGSKIAYMGLITLCVLIALARVLKAIQNRPEIHAFKPVLGAGLAILAMLTVNILVASSNGIGTTDWFRAVLPYIFLAVLPLIGLDAAVDSDPKWIRRVFVAAGLVAPLAFMTDWLDRRGVSALPIGRFAFASMSLTALIFGYALAMVAARERTKMWLAVAVYAPTAVLLTGTRSGLALLGGLVGAMGSSKKVRLPAMKALIAGATMVLTIAYIVPVIGSRLVVNNEFYDRLGNLAEQLQSGGLASDQSLLGRTYQTEVALSLFKENLWFGFGAGGTHAGVRTFDTAIAPLGYFGLVGAVVLLTYVGAWIVAAHRVRLVTGYTTDLTATRVFFVSMICYLPLSSVFDDKGLALAVMLVAALLASSRSGESAGEIRPAVSRALGARAT